MFLFILLLAKLLPLYALIMLGFIAGKFLAVKKESIAALLIYIVAPVVVFNGVVATKISASALSLPVLFFGAACLICLSFYFLASWVWKTSEKNVLALAAGGGNVGYFGLPVALALFGEAQLGVAVLAILGIILYENSLGFFITARGQHTGRQALIKLLKLPPIHAFFIGLAVNIYHISLGSAVFDIITSFRGAYTVLGMMLVGLGLAGVTRASFDYTFTGFAFLAKFIVWPAVMGLVVFIDWKFLHMYNPVIYKVIFLMSVVPLASNTVAFAAKLNTHPEKVAVTVLLSTLFALFYIPIFVALVFPLADKLVY